MSKKYPPPYDIVRLNDSERGWGVVSRPTGALVPQNGLTMKLTKEEAMANAAARNAAAEQEPDAKDRDPSGSDDPDHPL